MNAPSSPEYRKRSHSSGYLSTDFSSDQTSSPFLPYVTNPEKEAVVLAPWAHSWMPLIGLVLAVFLQASLLAGSLYIWRFPIARPVSKHLFGRITVKDFNLLVSLCGAIIGGAAAFGVAVGARSYLSRMLVGEGVSLLAYDSLWAVGNAGLGRRLSRYAILPIFIYILNNTASSAIVAIWTVGNEQVSSNFILPYVDIQSNVAHFDNIALGTLGAELLQPNDFEGLGFNAAQQLIANLSVADVDTLVDGLNMTLGGGIAPSLLQISTFRNSLKDGTSSATGLAPGRADIITNATTNEYLVSAPTVQATASCISLQLDPQSSPLTVHYLNATNSEFVVADVSDSNCDRDGAHLQVRQGTGTTSGAISCMKGDQAYISYYSFNTTLANDSLVTSKPEFYPLAACYVAVQAGVGENIIYFDLNQSYVLPDATQKQPFRLDPKTAVNATAYAAALVNNWWGIYSRQPAGSEGLSYLVRARYTLTRDAKNYLAADFVAYTQAIYSMAVIKMISTETYYQTDPAWKRIANGTFANNDVPVLGDYSNWATSDALLIGPTGYTSLLLFVVGATLLVLSAALGLAVLSPPVSLNPLDPVSVLLVAQNSPPSMSADGGCLGDADQVRSKSDKIQYRAVNEQHLAFVFGASYYDPPFFGRMYGSITQKVKDV